MINGLGNMVYAYKHRYLELGQVNTIRLTTVTYEFLYFSHHYYNQCIILLIKTIIVI